MPNLRPSSAPCPALRRRLLWSLSLAALAAPAWSQSPPPEQPEDETPAVEERIFVTGTRLPRAGEHSASPTQTITPQDFDLTGVGNIEQTLNLLPQIVPGYTNTSNNPGSGAATLDLRGLGSVRTLILVNGRRWIASDAGEVPEVDVSTIPAALIRRVDIVTGGASAVYGSDAVTGVINFILDDKLEGLHLEGRGGITEWGDGRTSSADLSFGTSFLGGRGHVVASAGWFDQTPVLQADRPLSRVSLQDSCAIPGTRDETGASTPVNDPECAPPNVWAMTAGGSTIIPDGRIVGAPTFIPVPNSNALIRSPGSEGLRFDPDGQPQPFIRAFDLYNFAPDNYLQIGYERWSANLLGSFEVSAAFTPYVELSYIDTRSPQQLAPAAAQLGGGSQTVPVATINLDNPFLTVDARRALDISFGIDAEGDRGFVGSSATGFSVNPAFSGDSDGIVVVPALQSRMTGLGPRQIHHHRKAKRGLAGARGAIGSGWSYDLYHSRSHVEHVTEYGNSGSRLRLQQALLAVRDPVTGEIVCLDPSNGCAPANLFGAGNLSEAAAEFIRASAQDITIIEEQVAEASVKGELSLLPAGKVGIVGGLNWRRSSYNFQPDAALFTGDLIAFEPGTPAAGKTSVWELFSEARVPLLADLPFVDELSAELGLRWSNYSSVGQTWTWKALGEWIPVRGVKLRGGFQRAVRAPNIRELFEQPSVSQTGFFEPCSAGLGFIANPVAAAACARNGVSDPTELFFLAFPIASFRGNPDLEAEVAKTMTIGVAFTPSFLPGLAVTLDYYDIRIRHPIGTFGGDGGLVAFGCIVGGADPADPLCQAYQRAPEGFIESIDLPTSNMEAMRARGIDWQAAYTFRFSGNSAERPHRLDLNVSGTHYFESSVQGNANLPSIECAGYFGAPCGNTVGGTATPKWKLYNRATWTLGPVSLALRHRWFSSTDHGLITFAETLGLPPFEFVSEEGKRYESRHYFDVAATFRIKDRFELAFGVNNLTGQEPAITGDNQAQANTDPSLYDVLGRRYFASLRVSTK